MVGHVLFVLTMRVAECKSVRAVAAVRWVRGSVEGHESMSVVCIKGVSDLLFHHTDP